MNLLINRFGPEKLAVLAFPCNLFGHQENAANEEIRNALRHVRPGNNFEPLCEMFSKVEVNGSREHPVFKYLKTALPLPADDPTSLIEDPKLIIWAPVKRSDISWNFEKFLIGPDGKPFRRYSKKYETVKIEDDIKNLMSQRGK
ncbi:Glutathione peroxidase 1 [Amphibalanus amphitrite]|uniref:Glutathione peroxidase n=1 Tax=Amphibalanus amphitrite TaxID=1232801 RepID=A0A6A4W0S1_AMPAM|nr:glutathione peroxidase 1-like [Amphibalanus amphitrite]KAF0301607.1 Glutathione peroxidase 1 [Amphibalanus amphitrite]